MDSNEKELSLTPIPGKSGKAYMGTYPDGGRVFVKMNTTPILAGLAKEQIAPQLLWSRRLPDGNVMSAQEWLNGEILTPNGMSKKQVVNTLPPSFFLVFIMNTRASGPCSDFRSSIFMRERASIRRRESLR